MHHIELYIRSTPQTRGGKTNLRAIFIRLLILKTANHIWNCDAFTCCFCNCFCFSLYSPAPLFYFNHLKQWPVFFGDLAYGLGCVVLISFCFVCFTHAAEHLHDKIQFLNFNFKWIYVAAILKCNPILALHTHTHTLRVLCLSICNVHNLASFWWENQKIETNDVHMNVEAVVVCLSCTMKNSSKLISLRLPFVQTKVSGLIEIVSNCIPTKDSLFKIGLRVCSLKWYETSVCSIIWTVEHSTKFSTFTPSNWQN